METLTRKPCFEDDGLASIADMEAGFSGGHQGHCAVYSRRNSIRNFQTPSFGRSPSPPTTTYSPRSGARFYDARYEEHQPHFLEACFLCKKPLSENKDIFMYRGDTPFCSEDCRSEQIEMDEAKEKNWNLSSMKAMRKNQEKRKSSSSPNKDRDYPFRTGTIAAA